MKKESTFQLSFFVCPLLVMIISWTILVSVWVSYFYTALNDTPAYENALYK